LWVGFSWLRIGTTGWLGEYGNDLPDFIKGEEFL
jgi:hypothetical protein